MGCYPPLAKFVSKALGKCNGRDRWREAARLDMDYAMAYPPGRPMQTHYVQPVARTVTFASNNNVYVIPQQNTPPPSPPPPQQEQGQEQSTPEPPPQQQAETPPQQQHAETDHHDTPPQPQPEQPEPPAPEQEEKAPDAAPPEEPKPKPPKGPKRGKNKKPGGRVRFGPEPPPPQEQQQPPQQQEEQHDAPDHGNEPGGQEGQQQGRHGPKGPGPGQVPAYLFRYTPSPLPRWEATPRRHEYFSGEYRNYYPTPVREGIYRIATDANRLTTIFSEENPNACTIV